MDLGIEAPWSDGPRDSSRLYAKYQAQYEHSIYHPLALRYTPYSRAFVVSMQAI